MESEPQRFRTRIANIQIPMRILFLQNVDSLTRHLVNGRVIPNPKPIQSSLKTSSARLGSQFDYIISSNHPCFNTSKSQRILSSIPIQPSLKPSQYPSLNPQFQYDLASHHPEFKLKGLVMETSKTNHSLFSLPTHTKPSFVETYSLASHLPLKSLQAQLSSSILFNYSCTDDLGTRRFPGNIRQWPGRELSEEVMSRGESRAGMRRRRTFTWERRLRSAGSNGRARARSTRQTDGVLQLRVLQLTVMARIEDGYYTGGLDKETGAITVIRAI
ncbi:hypothetical protein J6590_035649 [Homalodisca vitripennis]|nr:hypothetical protein J6590_035649 [Homalodisca vitripennis]